MSHVSLHGAKCPSLFVSPLNQPITPVTLHAPSRSERIYLHRRALRETAGPPQFCINLHLRETEATLASLRLVTSGINTAWVEDLSSHHAAGPWLLWPHGLTEEAWEVNEGNWGYTTVSSLHLWHVSSHFEASSVYLDSYCPHSIWERLNTWHKVHKKERGGATRQVNWFRVFIVDLQPLCQPLRCHTVLLCHYDWTGCNSCFFFFYLLKNHTLVFISTRNRSYIFHKLKWVDH